MLGLSRTVAGRESSLLGQSDSIRTPQDGDPQHPSMHCATPPAATLPMGTDSHPPTRERCGWIPLATRGTGVIVATRSLHFPWQQVSFQITIKLGLLTGSIDGVSPINIYLPTDI